jgi:hypothetical protein
MDVDLQIFFALFILIGLCVRLRLFVLLCGEQIQQTNPTAFGVSFTLFFFPLF